MTQLALDFPDRPAMGADDFLVAGPNEQAWKAVQDWPDWRDYGLVICGDSGSGKTHLAHIWYRRTSSAWLGPDDLAEAIEQVEKGRMTRAVVDDVDNWVSRHEQSLLHLLNTVRAHGGHVLLTARSAPSRWSVKLADLSSRLRAIAAVPIASPDDRLLAAIVVKLLKDRQLRVEPAVIDYLLTLMERSFAAANALIREIDRLSLSEGRAVTVPVARKALAQMARSRGTA